MTDGETQKGTSASDRLWRSKRVGRSRRQIRGVNSETRRGGAQPHKLTSTTLPRKSSKGVKPATVPQTDTGGWGEYPKALERTIVKELGNIAP